MPNLRNLGAMLMKDAGIESSLLRAEKPLFAGLGSLYSRAQSTISGRRQFAREFGGSFLNKKARATSARYAMGVEQRGARRLLAANRAARPNAVPFAPPTIPGEPQMWAGEHVASRIVSNNSPVASAKVATQAATSSASIGSSTLKSNRIGKIVDGIKSGVKKMQFGSMFSNAWANPMAKKAMIGAGAGALWGGIAGGMSDNGSAFGGMMGGALAGAGVGYGMNYLRSNSASILGRGAVGVYRGGARASNWMLGKTTGSFGRDLGLTMGSMGADGLRSLGRRSASLIGRNKAAINKYGSYSMAALGVGAGAYIGSSALSSNRGYR